jgi:cytochrome bd-type quinol oxidase subunit 2
MDTPAHSVTSPHAALGRVRAISGVMATAGVLIVLWFLAKGFAGRGAFLEVAERAEKSAWWMLMLPFAVYCTVRAFEIGVAPGAVFRGAPAGSLERSARWFDLVVFAFTLIVGLAFAFLLAVSEKNAVDPAGLYDELRARLGVPGWLVLFSLGLASVAMLVYAGAERLVGSLSRGRGWPSRVAVTAGVVLAAVLWAQSINVLAYFATGRPLLNLGARGDESGATSTPEPAGPKAPASRPR